MISPHYGLERVSYMLPVEGYEFATVRRLPIHRLERTGSFWEHTPLVLDRSAHLLHTFNSLPLNGLFVVSFELELPRYLNGPRAWQLRIGRELLQGRRCRAILALTELAASLARRELDAAGFSEAARKVELFRGGVAPGPVKQEPVGNDPLRLLFLGREAFRKGIVPTLDALEQLHRGGLELSLTVVSSLPDVVAYTHGEHTPEVDAFKARLGSLPWVRHFGSLPNAQVRRLMREHDLLLLPSFDEAQGWTAIEAGMEGLAPILTDIMSFPEVVENGVTGWMIPIELDEKRRWVGIHSTGRRRRDAIEQCNETITAGLIEVLGRVAGDRSLVQRWGEAARSKTMRMYHPDIAARRLEAIYGAALST